MYSTFSSYTGKKLEISNKRKCRKLKDCGNEVACSGTTQLKKKFFKKD